MNDCSQKDRMLAGVLYDAMDPELVAARTERGNSAKSSTPRAMLKKTCGETCVRAGPGES